MTGRADNGLLNLTPYELDGVAYSCKHEDATTRAGPDTQSLIQFEAPAYTRGPSGKKKHTYVWQCVRKRFGFLVLRLC